MNTQPLITLIRNRADDINALPSYAAAIEGVQAANLGMTVVTNLEVIIAALEAYGKDQAVSDVIANANENRQKRPNMLTFVEEVNEAELSARGKHDDPLRLELMQVAGICINLMRRIDAGDLISLKTDDIVADALAQRERNSSR